MQNFPPAFSPPQDGLGGNFPAPAGAGRAKLWKPGAVAPRLGQTVSPARFARPFHPCPPDGGPMSRKTVQTLAFWLLFALTLSVALKGTV